MTRAVRTWPFARTIVALADTLQLRTVAEGIEDGAQRAALRALGCNLGQGFLFARPIGHDELMQSITETPRQDNSVLTSAA